jgi:fermentation-respiration switch protein FrsA (DUF1100 family)
VSDRDRMTYDRRQLLARSGVAAAGAVFARHGLDAGNALAAGEAAPDGGRVSAERAVFRSSDGTKLVGYLRRRSHGRFPRPAIIVPTTMTGAQDQSVVTGYADGLAREGFVTFTFDQRGFGESGGGPRQHEDIPTRMVDLSAAVTFLRGLHGVVDPARIGGLGVSIAGGLLLRLTAFDPRMRAFVAIGAGLTHPHLMRDEFTPDEYAAHLARLARAAERFDKTRKLEYIPVVTPTGEGALFPSPDAFAYYGTGRGASRTWENRASALSLRTLLVDDVATMADLVGSRAGLLIVGERDRSTPVTWHEAVYERLTGPRGLFVVPGAAHNDLYDEQPYVSQAVEAAAAWFARHLD